VVPRCYIPGRSSLFGGFELPKVDGSSINADACGPLAAIWAVGYTAILAPPRAANTLVVDPVSRGFEDLKVAAAVVQLVPVDVVNGLAWECGADKAVEVDVPPLPIGERGHSDGVAAPIYPPLQVPEHLISFVIDNGK
jgi:hypothetical protein